jgi:hypothetical protein
MTGMMTVRTLLKADEEFIPVEEYVGRIADENYIEGALELTVGGKELLSRRHWDLVDQLWCYLARGVAKVSRGEAFSTYFPDSPIQVSFRPDLTRGEVTVRVDYESGPDDLQATVGLEEFKVTMAREARRSLDLLGRLAPGNRDAYEEALERLGTIN